MQEPFLAALLVLPFALLSLAQYTDKPPADFDESSFVYVKKNPLIRRRVSIKTEDIGEAAVLGDRCDQATYDNKVSKIYKTDLAANLSIYERSDMLFQHIVYLTDEFKGGNTGVRKSVCGANHLMACIGGSCRCMSGGDYNKYSMASTVIGSYSGSSYSECRVPDGGYCNPYGLLHCKPGSVCKSAPNDDYRCICASSTPGSEDFEPNPTPPPGISLPTPILEVERKGDKLCTKKFRPRPRSFQ